MKLISTDVASQLLISGGINRADESADKLFLALAALDGGLPLSAPNKIVEGD